MKEPIRVLHILQRMEAGGTQALLMNLYRKIDRRKLQFDFLVVYKEKQFYDDEIEKMGGHVYKLSFREDLNLLKFKKDLSVFFKHHSEYKIVHCHAYTIGYFCLKEAKKYGVPVRIAHSHSNSMTNDYKRYFKRIMQYLYTIYSTDLFACSEEAGKYLFLNKQFDVLKNAIDSYQFISNSNSRYLIRKELKIENCFVVGHVGRFKPEKNHVFLIDTFCEIKQKKHNSKLLLIGNGDPTEELQNYILKKGISNDVIILTNRNDMSQLYQAMDVFIFPSKYEGLGIVAIEAQAAGIPVLCSEGLPPETNITPLYKKIKLSDGAKKWADIALDMGQNLNSHSNMQQYIIDAGFDINATAKYMENYYLKKYNQNK